MEAPDFFNWRKRPQKWPKFKNEKNPILQTHPGLQLLLLLFLLIQPPWGTYCSKLGDLKKIRVPWGPEFRGQK